MKRTKVYCAGCACFFYIAGKPFCLATAKFVEGPIRNKIDVKGIVSAIRRNIKNDCQYRSSVSLAAWKIKKWLLREMYNGKRREDDFKKEYTYKKEQQHSEEVRKNTENRNKPENPKSESQGTEKIKAEGETGETVLGDRGVEDIDGGGSPCKSTGGTDDV